MLPGYLDKAAVTGVRTAACADVAVIAGGIVRPDRHIAAISALDRVGLNSCIGPDIGRGGVLHIRIGTMEIAADQHRAAAGYS